MNFKNSYYACVNPHRMVNLELTADFLIPNIYHYSPEDSHIKIIYPKFLHLLGGGNIHSDFPMSFSFQPLECFLILYTEKGGGKITCSGKTITAEEETLAFINCNNAFSLRSFLLPWNFKLFFINGRDMMLYCSFLPDFGDIFKIAEYSFVKNCFLSFLSVPAYPGVSDLLLMHKNLSEILCTICLAKKPAHPAAPKNVPGYLAELHDLLEHQYHKSFSLEKYEELFHVSRYRLCREFCAAYGMPPLRYLIRKRLEEAKKMLLTTDWTIHEISSKVGYDNVTHFINLFKKDTGLTPGIFRQTALEGQHVSRFPSR